MASIRIPRPFADGAVEDLCSALEAALGASDPFDLVDRSLKLQGEKIRVGRESYDLGRFRRVLVLGAGKASARMALGLERRIQDKISGGVVVAPEGQRKPPCKKVEVLDAPHPLLGEKSVGAARRMLSLVGRPSADDLVLCLFSGGGSALLELPDSGLGIEDLRKTTELLLRSGADIHEMNTVRKHLSRVKGGRLAELLYPATVVTLVMSDVVGDEPDAIASGPTSPDPTTYKDSRRILENRNIWEKVPPPVRVTIDEGVSGARKETPKPGAPCFSKGSLTVVGDNLRCRQAAARELRRRGFRTVVLPRSLTGEAREVGEAFSSRLKKESRMSRGPVALVGGGETTVTVVGKGRGGRNQELVLGALLALKEGERLWVASMGTDGVDGNSEAAGAVAGWRTLRRAASMRVDPWSYLEENDSNGFFRRVGGLIVTGSTGTNLNDVVVGVSEGGGKRRR